MSALLGIYQHNLLRLLNLMSNDKHFDLEIHKLSNYLGWSGDTQAGCILIL